MEADKSKEETKVKYSSCKQVKLTDLAEALIKTELTKYVGSEPDKVESLPSAPEAPQDVSVKDKENPSSTSSASVEASTGQGTDQGSSQSGQQHDVSEDTSIPVWHRKTLSQMTQDERNEYFEHICEDANYCANQPTEPLEASVAQMQAAGNALGDAFRRQLQRLILSSMPLGPECFRLVRQLNFFDASEPEDPEVSPGPDNRFPSVDVFAHKGLIFLSVHPTRMDSNVTHITLNDSRYIFPHYCLQVTSPLDATGAACILRSFIANFFRFRLAADGNPLNRFAKDFHCFLMFLNEKGVVYEICASQIFYVAPSRP